LQLKVGPFSRGKICSRKEAQRCSADEIRRVLGE
jgi:hypothetical protein